MLAVFDADSCGFQSLIDSAVPLEPFDVSLFRMFLDLAEQLHGFGLVAGFVAVVFGDDGFDFDRHHEATRSN